MLARGDALLLAAAAAQKILEPYEGALQVLEVLVYGALLGRDPLINAVELGVVCTCPTTDTQSALSLGEHLEQAANELRAHDTLNVYTIVIDVLWDKRLQRFYTEHSPYPNLVGTILSEHLRWDKTVGGLRYSGVEYLLDTYRPTAQQALLRDALAKQHRLGRPTAARS